MTRLLLAFALLSSPLAAAEPSPAAMAGVRAIITREGEPCPEVTSLQTYRFPDHPGSYMVAVCSDGGRWFIQQMGDGWRVVACAAVGC